MPATSRPLRSVLYIPGSNARALEKARQLPVDAIIFDLEDAVAPEEKASARATLAAALGAGGYGARLKIVRINALSTEWGAEDAAAAVKMGADAILQPKVDGPSDIDALGALTGNVPLWAMMETPLGMLNAAAIAAHPRCEGMVMGTNDLAKDMGARFRADRLPLMTGLGLCVLAAKAHGVAIVDGVYNAFKDEVGLAAECAQGRDMGFDGKTLIHPATSGRGECRVFADASRTRACGAPDRGLRCRPRPRQGSGGRRRKDRGEPSCCNGPRNTGKEGSDSSPSRGVTP